jgi:hypothetical protein
MTFQPSLLDGALLLPPGFHARWKELEHVRGERVALCDVVVTDLHVVVKVRGVERVGDRKHGDAAAADQVWEAAHAPWMPR